MQTESHHTVLASRLGAPAAEQLCIDGMPWWLVGISIWPFLGALAHSIECKCGNTTTDALHAAHLSCLCLLV